MRDRTRFDTRIDNEGLWFVISSGSLGGQDWEAVHERSLDEAGAREAVDAGLFIPIGLAEDNALMLRVVTGSLGDTERGWAAVSHARLRADCGRLVMGNGGSAIDRALLPDPGTRVFDIPKGDHAVDLYAYPPGAAFITGHWDLAPDDDEGDDEGRHVDLLLHLRPWGEESVVSSLSSEVCGQPALTWQIRRDPDGSAPLSRGRLRRGREFKPPRRRPGRGGDEPSGARVLSLIRAGKIAEAEALVARAQALEGEAIRLAMSLAFTQAPDSLFLGILEVRTDVTSDELDQWLFFGTEGFRVGVVGTLLAMGADPRAVSQYGRTAYRFAEKHDAAALALFDEHLDKRGK